MFRNVRTYVIGGALAIALGAVAYAQSTQWVWPFAGVQPQNSIDFKNPPLTQAPQMGVGKVGTALAVSNVPIGSIAYGSSGTDTTYAASTDMYVTSIFVPYDMTVTNLNFLAGATVGTNAVVGILYNAAGVAIGNSALTGTATSGATTFQSLPLVTPVAIQGPGVYYFGLQSAGTTDNFWAVKTLTYIGITSALQTGGVFGTVPALTVPTTFTVLYAPIVYLN